MTRIDTFYRNAMGPIWRDTLHYADAPTYFAIQHHVGHFQRPEGKTRLDASVHELVSAMAGFAPLGMGDATLTGWYRPVILPMIAVDGGS